MGNVARCLLMVLILLGLGGRMYAADASITVSGMEQGAPGSWDSGTVTISFGDSLGHAFSETVGYGQYSTAASIASTFGAMFSRDFIGSGLCAHAVGSVIYFHLKGAASFGPVSVSGSTVSFLLNTSLWPSNFINPPVALVCSPDHLITGSATSCTASVPASATGTIVFSLDGTTTLATVTLASGSATASNLLSSASLGGHIVTAAYSGDGSHAASSAFVGVVVNAAPGSLTSTTIYSYSIVNPDGSTGYAPNGNITGYTDSVNGNWSGIGYDALNRLTGANQNGTQYFCWAYDSFGNRTLQSQASAPFESGSPSCQAAGGVSPITVSASYQANNQIQPVSGVPSYDAAGDVTEDATNQYLYDDEGRVCAVLAPPLLAGWPANMVQYIYDAEGRRVAKGSIGTFSCDNSINPGTGLPNNGFTLTNSYALGLDGEQVTETGGDGQWLHTNVFVGGQLLATYDDTGVHSHIADWLGSRRVQANYQGQVEATYQNLPFGEMVPQNDTIFLGATEQHFTGKERDSESGNDYFGARYYASTMGRFMSPDWAAKVTPVPYAKLGNPQSLNLYSYVWNNPLRSSDPDGHDICTQDQTGKTTGCQKESKWHNFWYGNTYLLKADNGQTYHLDEQLKQLPDGQKYSIMTEAQTKQALNDMAMSHVGDPGAASPSLHQVYDVSLTTYENGGVDFKPYLNSTFGAHTLWLLGDDAHRSDFIGNVAWGFLMGSWGYSETTAHLGAGAQQAVHDIRRGGPLEGSPKTLFDDPNDYHAIHMGFAWWNGATLP